MLMNHYRSFGFFNTNILGTYNVLEAVRKHGAVSFTSLHVRSTAMGTTEEFALLNESSEMRPNSPYAALRSGR